MYGIVFNYGCARFIEVAVVGLDADKLRLIPKGDSDAIELNRKGSEWISETGEAFAIGFIAPFVGEADGARNLTQINR